jgi:hypothetical protein
MTVVEIPLSPTPSQFINVRLGAQACKLAIYQKRTGLFIDIYVNDVLVLGGALCRDRVYIVRDAYLGFNGDLAFADNQGLNDPDYTGLGARFQLFWFDA